jgi:type II secretory ATPase GspE/PulE/Tfp pilus assembly ATPase PilB-like protein
MIDMGVEPFLLISTVNVVMAQRLVRVLCECKEPYEATPEILDTLHESLDTLNGFNIYDENHKLKLHFDKNTKAVTLYKPKGCPKCNNTGYISRTGIFEALKMSETISKMVMTNSTISEINEQAQKEGMVSMQQDGFIKALEGITTIEEVLRVKNE